MTSNEKGMKRNRRKKESRVKVLRRRSAMRKTAKADATGDRLKKLADGKGVPIVRGESFLAKNAARVEELKKEQEQYDELRRANKDVDLGEKLKDINQEIIDANLEGSNE